MKKSDLIPLISDLKNIHIGSFLNSSRFERLVVKIGYGDVWETYYETTKKNRKSLVLGYDQKPLNCRDAFLSMISDLYPLDRNSFDSFIHITLIEFIDWNYKDLDFGEIFEDLKIINFPNDLLTEIREKYLHKNRMILDNIKLDKKQNSQEKDDIRKKEQEIDNKKKSWLKAISKAKTQEVIDSMVEYFLNKQFDELGQKLLNLSARYHRIQNKAREGIIDIDAENKEMNNINKALIELMNRIE